MQRNGPRMALHRVMLLLFALLPLPLLELQLVAFPVFTLAVGHLLLSLTLDKFALAGVSLTLTVDGLRRGVLHGLANARKRVSAAMGRR